MTARWRASSYREKTKEDSSQICHLLKGHCPGSRDLSPSPSRAPISVSPQMGVCQGHRNMCCSGDQALGLVEASSTTAGTQECCRPSTALWARLLDLPLHLVCYLLSGTKTHGLMIPKDGGKGEGHMHKREPSSLRVRKSRSWSWLCVTLGKPPHLTGSGFPICTIRGLD